MEKHLVIPGKYVGALTTAVVFGALYLSSLYSYPFFHSLAEIFSIVVACGIFMVAWNSRRLLDNHYLLFIGIAYLFIANIDLIHTLGYKGMGVFQGYDTGLSVQLWIGGRYLQSLSLLAAPLFIRRKLNISFMIIGYTVATTLIFLSIFYWRNFPVCFVEGEGLTLFKKVSEYIISLILLFALALLFRNRKDFDKSVLGLLVTSIALTIGSELAFTFYTDVYGLLNTIGHFFKILAFYFIYKALVEVGLTKPYQLLFRNLKQNEEELRKHRDHLKELVDEQAKKIRLSFLRSITALAIALEAKDKYTSGHSQRVAEVSVAIARELGISARGIEKIRLAALVHDIGKIGVSEYILNKPGKLTNDEYQHVKGHPEMGEHILIPLVGHKDILKVVRYHHERYDGFGYPDRLSGEQIPVGARILAVADAYDAMTSERPYRKAMDAEASCNEIIRCKGTQFAPDVVDAFVKTRESISSALGHLLPVKV